LEVVLGKTGRGDRIATLDILGGGRECGRKEARFLSKFEKCGGGKAFFVRVTVD
jgi:hypothetical protein